MTIAAPSFPLSNPVIPAKAGIQKVVHTLDLTASAICQRALRRARRAETVA